MTEAAQMLILPLGTQVVALVDAIDETGSIAAPAGAVGVLTAVPDEPGSRYRVRFPNGAEAGLLRQELRVRKHVQRDAVTAPEPVDLERYIIYRCVMGSRAYGLDDDSSDTDRRGIYLPPASLHWGLAGVPEQLEDPLTRDTYWELQKFMMLALKANPNILECLATPLVEQISPLAEELRAERAMFLSKLIYQTYNGYVLSQFKRMEQDMRTAGTIKPKHAMHLIRLLLAGITALREGFIPVDVGEHRERLLAIKHAQQSLEEVNAWRLELHREFDAAYATTRLPDRPDYERANALLLRARRSAVDID